MHYLVWNVDPAIFQLGPFAPRWYGVFFTFGFGLGYLIMVQIYRHETRQLENLSNLFLYVFLGTLIGARLGHVLFYQPDYYLARPWEIFMIWQGGLASHGGFAGVLIAVYLYLRKYRDMSFIELGDRMAVAVMPAAAFIRLGNFFNSEILGVPTDLPWGVVFMRVDPIPRHPAMLYESLSYLLGFCAIYAACWKTDLMKAPGRVLGLVLAFSFSARFLIEFVKEEQAHFEEAMLLNMGQLLSIPFILAGLVLVYRAGRLGRRGPRSSRRRKSPGAAIR